MREERLDLTWVNVTNDHVINAGQFRLIRFRFSWHYLVPTLLVPELAPGLWLVAGLVRVLVDD